MAREVDGGLTCGAAAHGGGGSAQLGVVEGGTRADGLGQPEAKAQGGADQLGWKQGF
jgi:hypothetical protein